MKRYRLPIFYEHAALVEIEADTLEEAINLFKDGDFNENQIDDESLQFTDGPWELDEDGALEVEPEDD